MCAISYRKQIIIWGTGLNSVKFTYQVNDMYNIAGYIDSQGDYGHFIGKKVYRLSEISDIIDYYIVFAGTYPVYEAQIRPQLWALGLKEFVDFIFGGWYGKQMVLLHGNCHMIALREALECSSEFEEKYFIYPIESIQKYEVGETIDVHLLKHCNVFIHQDIRPENEFGYKLSDEYLLPRLSEGCKKITVPLLYGLGKAFFPQYRGGNKDNKPLYNGGDISGMFRDFDCMIGEGVKNIKSVDDIITRIETEAFTKEEILDNFNTYMSKVKNREVSWDIKIYDFILSHYKEEKLFYDPGHPTEIIIEYYAQKTLELLGIYAKEKLVSKPMDIFETPIYPCVKETLGIKWDTQYIRKSEGGRKFKDMMDLEEYIREYIAWCYTDYES